MRCPEKRAPLLFQRSASSPFHGLRIVLPLPFPEDKTQPVVWILTLDPVTEYIVPCTPSPLGKTFKVVLTPAPGFRYKNHIRIDLSRFPGDGIQGFPVQHGGEIETKTIDVIILHPEKDAIHDQAPRHGPFCF